MPTYIERPRKVTAIRWDGTNAGEIARTFGNDVRYAGRENGKDNLLISPQGPICRVGDWIYRTNAAKGAMAVCTDTYFRNHFIEVA